MPLVLVGPPTAAVSPRAAEVTATADAVIGPDADDADVLAQLAAGRTVALAVDWGAPSAFRLVRAAVAAGIPVTAAPGPSRVIAALALSGLPADRFCVEAPDRLAELAAEPRTVVLPAPGDLGAAVAAFGPDRPAAVVGASGQVRRGPLGELAAQPPAGEVTLVVGGAPPVAVVRPADPALAAAVAALESSGTPRKAAIASVAAAHGLPKRDVYNAVVLSR